MAKYTNRAGEQVATIASWVSFPPANHHLDGINLRQAYRLAWKATPQFPQLPELITAQQFVALILPFCTTIVASEVCPRCKGVGEYSYNPIDGTTCLACNGTGKK